MNDYKIVENFEKDIVELYVNDVFKAAWCLEAYTKRTNDIVVQMLMEATVEDGV